MELFRDPLLLQEIRNEIEISALHHPFGVSEPPEIDLQSLQTCLLLQSAYAEVLRLYTYNFLVSTSDHDDFTFKGWLIPQNRMVAISSHTAHMDSQVWNTDSPSAHHPLGSFWAKRFLRQCSDNPRGPLKVKSSSGTNPDAQSDGWPQNTSAGDAKPRETRKGPQESAEFSLTGLSGIWMPFGGGYSLCPGRHIAKQEILISVAMLCTVLDIELIQKPSLQERLGLGGKVTKEFGQDMRYFGMGILPPKKEVWARIRERSVA